MTIVPSEFPLLAQSGEPSDLGPFKWVLLAGLIALAVAAVVVARHDMRRLSGRRVWALAVQTFRESVRRRILLLMPGAMGLILAIGLFQRSFSEIGDIHQSTELCIRTSSALTLLLVILLSAFSFPRELESRTIYTLLAKPVTRLEVFVGKVLGLWLVALVVLSLLGAFSYGYLRYRASRLIHQAEARLAEQQRQFEQYQVSLKRPPQTTQPAEPGTPDRDRGKLATPAVAPAIWPRYEPPDAALRQMAEMGMLTAMNYVNPAGPVRIAPEVPAALREGNWQWLISGRGYLALYSLSLPAVEERGERSRLTLILRLPDATVEDSPRVQVQLFTRRAPESRLLPLALAPRAVYAAGWQVAVGEPLVVNLRPERSGLWGGDVALPAYLPQALGPIRELAVGITPPNYGRFQAGQLIGLRPPPPGEMDVRALTSADSLVLTMGSGPAEGGPQALRPTELTIFPRVRSLRQYPVSGASSETGAVESAEYSFSGIDRADLPAGDLVFQLDFEVEKGTPASVPTQAVVGVTNPQVGGEPLSLTIYPSTRMGNFIRVPRQFAAGGRLNIRIRPGHADDLFGMRGRSVRLLARPTGFAVNLVKSLAICAVQTVVVVGIGVTASVFLSWPVALLLTSVILMAGNLLNVVRGMLHTTGMQIFDVTGSGEPIDLVGRAVNVLLERTSQVIDLVVPDFTKFDPVAFIGSGLNIPMAGVASDLGWALLYLVVAMFIGYLSLHFKEVGR